MSRHDFPVYASHEAAYCFNCGGDWRGGAYPQRSGWPDGRGAWKRHCDKCGHDIWYDVKGRYEAGGDFYDAGGNPPRWITAAERRAMQDDQDAEELF